MKKQKTITPAEASVEVDGFYRRIGPLKQYIDRIGAEELNFRRFIVRDYKGAYYTERSIIRLFPNGDIKSSNKEYAPTKEEEAAIKASVIVEKFPASILARNTNALMPLIRKGNPLFEFHSRREPGIIMVQERMEVEGKKAYVPWCQFDDGKWRRMEPDGLLPFWKPHKKTNKPRVMIHEGAKAAAFVNDLIHDKERLAAHPWGEHLAEFEHWGMIGGALAPHRADYPELRREQFIEVVYICDNDWPGKSALQKISKQYGGPMKGVVFDGNWKDSWDMADEMPKGFFTKAGRYKGPTLKSLYQYATWATDIIPNPEGGRSLTKINDAFREEWFHSVTPEVFIHSEFPHQIMTMPEFNNKLSPYSDVDDTARLLKKDAASKSAVLKYSPAMKPGIYSSGESGRFINTHVPSEIKAEKGETKPWLDFMKHLITVEEDRIELMRWCATLIARPDVKMLYGVLLISAEQGVGKGTLGEKILAPLLGANNVSYPSEQEIVESNFNYWLAHKRLAVVHEIYAGHSSKAYNRLKSVITDRYITVSKKFQANYEVENWMHVYACSNSLRAIQLSGDDRRWFLPKVTEEKFIGKVCARFYEWLNNEGGLNIVKWWAEEWLEENEPVKSGDPAPWSALKKEVIEEGYSPGMALVSKFLERVREESANPKWIEATSKPGWATGEWTPPGGVMVLDTELVTLIKNHLYDGRQNDRLEKPLTTRKVAKNAGWFISEHRASIDKWGTRGVVCRLISTNAAMAERMPSDLAETLKPIDVQKLAQEWKL